MNERLSFADLVPFWVSAEEAESIEPVLDENTRGILLVLRERFGISWQEARQMPQQELAMLFDALEEAYERQATNGRSPRPTVAMGGDDAEVPSDLAAL